MMPSSNHSQEVVAKVEIFVLGSHAPHAHRSWEACEPVGRVQGLGVSALVHIKYCKEAH